MRMVVAPDKFRGSLSAAEAARALARGVRAADPSAVVDEVPMADGGEGTVEALVAATRGTFREAEVTGPLGEPVRARFGLLGHGTTAALEMASVSGLALVPPDRRDPSRTTTRGTGELLLAAVEAGARRVVLGIGGSATNDGGAGLAQALGYRLLDRDGRDIGPGGGSLDRLARIDPSGRDHRLDGVEVEVACDVDNPLCGPRGASAVYGPQKGADPDMIRSLDRNLGHLAGIVVRDLGLTVAEIPGAGAAGGLGAGLVAFASARLERGVTLVIRAVGLADRLRGADLCLTGEGAIDASSAFGKTAVGVARLARSLGVPTLALAGTLGPGSETVLAEGVDGLFSLCPGPIALEEAVARAPELLERAAEHAVRGFLAGWRRSDRTG
jgi:glycerate kinase